MMDMLDYLDMFKDKNFYEYPFNDIDNLILSQLSYLPLGGIVPSLYEKGLTLYEVSLRYFSKYDDKFLKKQWYLIPKVSNLLSKMASSKRYKDAILYNYVNMVDDQKQFGALSIRLNDNSIYVSYEGTDNTTIGWKEDFIMACNYPVHSQLLAAKYLNRSIRIYDKVVRIGGHSKGGNLAVSAAMGCNFFIKNKIVAIYNNDGPGFLKEQVESKQYKKILPKIKMFVPKDSIVGMLLYHQVDYTVVKSNKLGIFQHDAFTWVCNKNSFVVDKLSAKSKRVAKKLNAKLETYTPLDKQKIVEDIFSIFEDNQIKLLKEINLKKLFNLFISFRNVDKETKKLVLEFIKLIFI